ncbi:MAG TPA: alpha/beta hydrolase [Coriobacteriia bacterium]|nr:alpha/beta hydrolase [Coriobacteriia bacterium]
MRAEKLSWPRMAAGLKLRAAGSPDDLCEDRIDFGDDPAQHVLVIRPASGRPERPIVCFVHGGSWQRGDPETYRGVGRFFARHGYTALVAGYRLVPGAVFPAQRDDVLTGLSAGLEYVAADSGEGPALLLVGQSAGAQLAALAALDTESRSAAGLADIAIAGLVAVSGPLDFDVMCSERSRCPLVEALMGGRDGWEAADPARFAHGGPPVPILCLHGSLDPLVSSEVAASFVMRANGAEGDHATFIADPTAHHADMTRLFFGTSPLTPVMLEWMEQVTGS